MCSRVPSPISLPYLFPFHNRWLECELAREVKNGGISTTPPPSFVIETPTCEVGQQANGYDCGVFVLMYAFHMMR